MAGRQPAGKGSGSAPILAELVLAGDVGVAGAERATPLLVNDAGLRASSLAGLVAQDGVPAKTIDLPLKGVRELQLVVTDGGNGKGGDHADWAEAYVE